MQQIDERPSVESPREAGSTEDRAAAARHRVLVVDDDTDTLDFAMEALLLEGCQIQCATNGLAGLALAQKVPPDLVVTDLKMPLMNGRQLCDAVRQTPSLARTRILIMSGVHDAHSIAAECHADGLVTKPFTSAFLRHRVRSLLGM